MKLRLKYLLIIFSIFVVYSCYYWGIPFVANNINLEKKIETISKNTFGYKIDIEKIKIKMGYLPSIWIFADSFTLLNDDNSKAFYVKKPILKINLLPLILNKVNIKYFWADDIFADFTCDKNLRLYIGQYLIIKSTNSNIKLDNAKIIVNKYKLNLFDESIYKKVVVNGDFLKIDELILNKKISFSTSAELIGEKSSSNINLDVDMFLPFNKNFRQKTPKINATVTNLNLSDYSNYIRYFTNNTIKSIGGILYLDIQSQNKTKEKDDFKLNLILNKFFIDSKHLTKKTVLTGDIKVFSKFNILRNKFLIKNFEFRYPNVNINLTGDIDKITSKSPVLDLNLKIFNTKAEKILEILPSCPKLDKKAGINISLTKESGFWGDVTSDILIKNNPKTPDIKGSLTITNAIAIEKIKNAKLAVIKLLYKGKSLGMDVEVPTGYNEKVTVQGNLDIYGTNISLFIKSSPHTNLATVQKILNPLHKVLNFELGPLPVMKLTGFGNINLQVNGNVKNPSLNGILNTISATAEFLDIKHLQLNNAYAELRFQDKNTYFNLKQGKINQKPVKISGNCSLKGVFNYNVSATKQYLNDLLPILKDSPLIKDMGFNTQFVDSAEGFANVDINIKGEVTDIEKINFGKNFIISGIIDLAPSKIKLKEFNKTLTDLYGKIYFNNLDFKINLTSNILTSKLFVTGKVKGDIANILFTANNFKLTDLINFLNIDKLKTAADSGSSAFSVKAHYDGKLSQLNPKNFKIKSDINLKKIKLIYDNIPINIFSGFLKIEDSTIKINKLNLLIANMPTLLDAKITNIFTKPKFDVYANAKPNQDFLDMIYNKKQIYPIKIKGDVQVSAIINGTLDKINSRLNCKFEEDSSIYYMGASLGDAHSPINIVLETIGNNNKFIIKNFFYDKLIRSQNNRQNISRQLSASGELTYADDNLFFNNFNIKTSTPTDTRIFNIIFKKPLIKNGLFTSDIVINGSLKAPQIKGPFKLIGINIPFFETTIKDISLDFQNKNILLDAKGDVFSNTFTINANLLNKLTAPYIINFAEISSEKININKMINSFKQLELESAKRNITTISSKSSNNFNMDSFIIKKAVFSANNVEIKNLTAKDFEANLSLSEDKIISVDTFNFNLAQGDVDGSMDYNLINNETDFNLGVKNANANLMMIALFDLPNQIFGNLDGNIRLACNGKNYDTCIHSVSGHGAFQVNEGKMPKLGSLEYLLKASNLFKSGVTGLSVGSVVDLVSPLKTGSFKSIKGSSEFNNGIANNVQIFSSGDNLSIYVAGNYNLATFNAEMYVYGVLKKKVQNILGAFGNLSLNTLFSTIPGVTLSGNEALLKNINKIPGIELYNKNYRIFAVDINGNLNGDDYVKTFQWVE